MLRGLQEPLLGAAQQYLARLYHSEIRFTDHQVARLLAGIEEAGRADNAVIVIMGDHGDELGDREGRWVGHTKVICQDVLHVPLVIKLPHGRQPRARVEEPVSLVDLMPTIAQASGLALPPSLELYGRPLDLERPQGQRPAVFAETGRWARMQAELQGDWKLVSYPNDHLGTLSLFNLATDPREQQDVSTEQPAVVAAMQAQLDTWNAAIEGDHKRLQPASREPALTPEEEEALRAMGYIE